MKNNKLFTSFKKLKVDENLKFYIIISFIITLLFCFGIYWYQQNKIWDIKLKHDLKTLDMKYEHNSQIDNLKKEIEYSKKVIEGLKKEKGNNN